MGKKKLLIFLVPTACLASAACRASACRCDASALASPPPPAAPTALPLPLAAGGSACGDKRAAGQHRGQAGGGVLLVHLCSCTRCCGCCCGWVVGWVGRPCRSHTYGTRALTAGIACGQAISA